MYVENDSHLLLTETCENDIQAELAETVLKISSKQPDVPAIY